MGAAAPGFVGILDFRSVVISTVLVSGAAVVFFARRKPLQRAPCGIALPQGRVLLGISLLAVVLAITGLKTGFGLPARKSFVEWLLYASNGVGDVNQVVFAYDAVVYHFPALIDFWGAGALWIGKGELQSYSFGAEILALLPIMGMRSLNVVPLMNIVSTLLLLGVAVSIAAAVAPRRVAPAAKFVLCCIVAALVWREIDGWAQMIGKNDLFAAGCALAALRLALRREPGDAVQGAFSGMALALAIGAKPNMLIFLPVWAAFFSSELVGRDFRTLASAACALVPGFAFLIRNLIQTGSILGGVPGGAGPTLLFDAGASRLLSLMSLSDNRERALIILIGILVGAVGAFATPSRRRVFLTLTLWTVVGAVGFLATPFSLFIDDAIQWRFAIVPETLAVVLFVSVSAAFVEARWPRIFRPLATVSYRRILPQKAPVAVVAALASIVALSLALGRGSLVGFRGYDVVDGVPTGIFSFIQTQPTGLRILAINLPSLGIYGRDLGNRIVARSVFPADERATLNQIWSVDKPDDYDMLILATPRALNFRLPHSGPFFSGLRPEDLGFVEVYRDEVARAYHRR